MPTVTSANKEQHDREFMEKRGQLKKEKTQRIYHGSHEEDLSEVKDNGSYGGLFGNVDKGSALSHADNLYYADIPEEKLLTHHDLNYELPYKKVSEALKKVHYPSSKNEEMHDKTWDIVIGDKGQNTFHLNEDELKDIFGASDHGEAGIEAQRLRGQISKHLGYHAVELEDEHGTSYLMQPGVKMNKVKDEY